MLTNATTQATADAPEMKWPLVIETIVIASLIKQENFSQIAQNK